MASEAAAAPAASGDKKGLRKSDLILVALWLYVIALGVLAADRLFGLGIWVPKLDRQIKAAILDLNNPALSMEKRKESQDFVVNYHEFSIPHLIKTLEKGEPALAKPATYCLEQIAGKFFGQDCRTFGPNASAWKNWWTKTEAELDKKLKDKAIH